MRFNKRLMMWPSFGLFREWAKRRSSNGLILLATGLLVTSFAPSCQKYEEGPLLSFRSPEKRITNEWTVAYAEDIAKAENITEKFQEVNYSLRISKNDSFQLSYNAPARSGGLQQRKITGSWELVDDNQKIKWRFQGYDPYRFLGNDKETSTILKLKKDELWMENEAGTLELHLKPL